MNIGEKIRNIREGKDITQRELATAININESVWSRIESGERSIRDDELIKIADFLDVSTDYLLGRTTYKKTITSPLIAAHAKDNLTDEELEEIEKFVEFLKSKRD